jgi:hypothetical protein
VTTPHQRYLLQQAAAARLTPEPDGTTTLRSDDARARQETMVPTWPTLHAGHHVDDLTAVQIAVGMILETLDIVSIDRLALLEGRREHGKFRLNRTHFDWPETRVDAVPVLQACVHQESDTETVLSAPSNGQAVIDDTEDVYAPNSVLQLLGEAQTRLEIVVWCASKDDRAGVRKALVEAFLAGPTDERSDRQIVVPQYYDRPVRLTFTGVGYPDTPETAQANTWPLVARVTSTVELVRLVPKPPTLMARATLIAGADPDE